MSKLNISVEDAVQLARQARPVLKQAVAEGEKLGREAERAAVVKYLRSLLDDCERDLRHTYMDLADAIEKGEHHK